MIYDVTISEQADADLRSVYEYIAFELLSPEHAA
jgi:toxin ParE1/3/4